MKEILEKYKDAFLKELHEMLNIYCLIGWDQSESPMWMQYRGVEQREDKLVILFVNSQRESLWFWIAIDPRDEGYFYNYQEVYNYFRSLKYDHIKEYWPTVFNEQSRVK